MARPKPMKWHLAAEAFPMMSDDDLTELAEDIKVRGLVQPIVVLPDGVGLDGRNRWKACQQAGVTPTTVVYDGDDPVGFVLAANVHRRHMSKGSRAMATVKATNSSGITTYALAETAEVGQPTIAKAAAVLEHAPELVDAVIGGSTPLNEAYELAQRRKQDQAIEAKRASESEKRLARLPAELRDLVVEGTLSLEGAEAEIAQRRQREEDQRRVTSGLLVGAVEWACEGLATEERLMQVAERFEQRLCGRPFEVTSVTIKQAAENLAALAGAWRDDD